MKTKHRLSTMIGCACGVAAALAVLACGCGKSANESGTSAPIPKPQEAASQLQRAFVSAPVEVKQTATVATEALRTADYERAMQSLRTIKARTDLTAEQSMAIHESEAAMEARLISAMEGGDLRAKQAYERLKKSRRQ